MIGGAIVVLVVVGFIVWYFNFRESNGNGGGQPQTDEITALSGMFDDFFKKQAEKYTLKIGNDKKS